ncbi:hypothetical protein V6N11_008883 [Hibiscus sabdariffa]|uniref:Uncharacterized protein n=1 Tax=Hibiscus sabdariffa TaxID=183260 RepID=A0ABR1ZR42_9ROSI
MNQVTWLSSCNCSLGTHITSASFFDFIEVDDLGHYLCNVSPGLPLVKWETIQKSIEDGGLGFKSLHQQNKTLLLKIGYQFVCDVDKLWVQVLRAKYKWEEALSLEIT